MSLLLSDKLLHAWLSICSISYWIMHNAGTPLCVTSSLPHLPLVDRFYKYDILKQLSNLVIAGRELAITRLPVLVIEMLPLECAVCLQRPFDPYVLPACGHYYCKGCLNMILPNDGKLLCPLCRREFSMDDIKPYLPKREFRLLLDLEYKPDKTACWRSLCGHLQSEYISDAEECSLLYKFKQSQWSRQEVWNEAQIGPASYRHLCIFLAFDFVYYLCPCSQTFLITELYLIVQRVLLLIWHDWWNKSISGTCWSEDNVH